MTASRIVIPRALWEEARKHLFRSRDEHFGFFFAGVGRAGPAFRLALREFIPVQYEHLETDPRVPRQIKLDFLLDIINRAKQADAAIVEAHTHPLSRGEVEFSFFDKEEIPSFANYVLGSIPSRPYIATVWGTDTVAAWVFPPDERPFRVREVSVLGANLTKVRQDASPKDGNPLGPARRFSRQVLAFGETGQSRIAETRVAVVGLGGLGSHVAQQLAYLGVREFVLIDPDRVEETNLNRLIGARPKDVGKPKVEVAKREIEDIAGKKTVEVVPLCKDLRTKDALDAVIGTDVVFGCVDNDGPRLILNEVSRAYMLPYIDTATGIEAKDNRVGQAGGRVIFVHPEGPCLNCLGEIDIQEARDYLATSAEREQSRRLGYVADMDNPSVVSLNGVTASIAVTEFMTWVTGIRPARAYSTYYAMDRMEPTPASVRQVERDPECYTCSLNGIGDHVELSRYVSKP